MEDKTDEFRLQNYRAMENRLLSANSDVKRLEEELASLKEVVKELIPIAERMEGSLWMSEKSGDKIMVTQWNAVINRAKTLL